MTFATKRKATMWRESREREQSRERGEQRERRAEQRGEQSREESRERAEQRERRAERQGQWVNTAAGCIHSVGGGGFGVEEHVHATARTL
jgi:hypothetical protein